MPDITLRDNGTDGDIDLSDDVAQVSFTPRLMLLGVG